MQAEVAMFDSPFAYCPKCNEMVLLDQTQRECKADHRCGDIDCPLLAFFTGYDFRQPPAARRRKERRDDPS